MSVKKRDLPTRWLAPLGMLVMALQIGCADAPADVEYPPAQTYEVRGVVRQIRTLPDERFELSIHHEAIPEFVTIQGEVQPMEAMTMPFLTADSLDLEGLAAGSIVRFALEVDWSATEPALITVIERLPDDTELAFSPSE